MYSGRRSVVNRYRIRGQAAPNSAAMTWVIPVEFPCPPSVCAMIAVTTSSSPIARKALNCPETADGSPARPGLTGRWKARRKAVVPIPSRKLRRLVPPTISRAELVSTVFMAARSLLTEMLRGFRDRGADPRISAASTDVAAHCGVDVITRGVGLEQRYRRHDLTRLAVATLGHIVLDPG